MQKHPSEDIKKFPIPVTRTTLNPSPKALDAPPQIARYQWPHTMPCLAFPCPGSQVTIAIPPTKHPPPSPPPAQASATHSLLYPHPTHSRIVQPTPHPTAPNPTPFMHPQSKASIFAAMSRLSLYHRCLGICRRACWRGRGSD